MNKLKSNFDYSKKIPSSRPLFTKKRNINPDSNIIYTIANKQQQILSEYDLSGLDNKLLLTETNSNKDIFPLLSSPEGNEFYIKKQKSVERQYLNDQLRQIQARVPDAIIKGVSLGIGGSLKEIESNIINEQLELSSVPRSVNNLLSIKSKQGTSKRNRSYTNTDSNNENSMTHEAVKLIKDLKEKEEKIKKSIYKLDNNQRTLEQESYLNLSNNIIEENIRNDKLKEIKGRKETLITKLEEVNQRVIKIIENNKPLNRNENIKQFIANFDFDKDDFPSKRQFLEKQSMQLKENRLNDLSIVQEKKKKNLDQMEKESIEQRGKFLADLHEKEAAIVKKRKHEMNIQMDKTKQFINEQVNKTEKDYLFYLNKEKFEFEQKKIFDKIKMQKKDELLSREDYIEFTKKLKQNKKELNQENIEKITIIKEMWKNRSQLLPSFKSNLLKIVEEEKRKEKEEEELLLKKKQEQINQGIAFASERIPKPKISKALKKERENRIYRLKNKRNVIRKRYQKKKLPINIPIVHKKAQSDLPTFTKPLKQLDVLPNYLEDLKKKREHNTSPVLSKDWEKELNDNKGTIIENVELLKLQTEVIDKKVQQKKQFMKSNGGYAQQSEVGDAIGDLLIDSIKAKLTIINKLKGKAFQY